MPDHLCNTHHSRGTQGKHLAVCLVVCLLVLTSVTHGSAADKVASNKQPLSFGQGQTIIDLQKVVWEPLKGADLYPYFLRFGGAGRMIQYMVVRSVRC
jgi:hypothetical protein